MKASSRSRNTAAAGVVGDYRPQAQEHRVLGRFAALDGIEFGLVAGQQLAWRSAGAALAFVGEVVGVAGEPVDGRHRLAQARRQQDRGDGESSRSGRRPCAGLATRRKLRILPALSFKSGLSQQPAAIAGVSGKQVKLAIHSVSAGLDRGPRDMRPGGEIGRRTRFRFWRRKAWGFESLPGHQHVGASVNCMPVAWHGFFDELFDTDTEMTETATTAVATETVSALERRIDMTVVLADIEKDVDQRLKHMSRTVKMAGFRPGKVPMKMVAQQYGSQARSEAIGAAVEKAYGEKVREQNLRVAGYPRIEPKADAVEGQLGFTAIFEVYPEISLGDVSGEAIEKPTLTVTEAEVDKTLDVLRKQRTTYSETERASETGDRLVIDFIGRKNGEEFQGGKASDYTVMVGGGMMLPDFETQLVGVKAGDHKSFDVAFPADYQAAELAGNTVQFEMTVKKVEAPQLPEIDGDLPGNSAWPMATRPRCAPKCVPTWSVKSRSACWPRSRNR
jgi:hypothetical protein